MSNIVKTRAELQKQTVVDLSLINTMEDAIAIKTPVLSLVRKDNGSAYARNIITTHIAKMHERLNITNAMSSPQIQDAAELILKHYWQLTLGDLKVIFERATMGDYGEIYNRLDISVISKWCREYLINRTGKHQGNSDSTHDQIKDHVKKQSEQRQATEFYNK